MENKERMEILEKSLTEQEKKVIALFKELPKHIMYMDGYMLTRNTKSDYTVRLMLGYNTSKNPIKTGPYRVANRDLMLKLTEVLEDVQLKAKESRDTSAKLELEALF